eukprot:Colp12_sorted_trinity150504_noHs@9274
MAPKRKSTAPPAAAPKAKRVRHEHGAAAHAQKAPEIGRLFVLGMNDMYQLGLGPAEKRKYPYAHPDLTNAKSIACGGMHSVVLGEDGKVYTTGVNDDSPLGRDGEEDTFGVVKGAIEGKNIVQVAAGDSFSLFLDDQGVVYGCGIYRDKEGKLGFLDSTDSRKEPVELFHVKEHKIVKLACGTDHTLALTESGEVFSWGYGATGALGRVGERTSERARLRAFLLPQKIKFPRNKRILDVFAGGYSSTAIAEDHSVYVWGLNNCGQLGTGVQGSDGDAENPNQSIFSPELVKFWSELPDGDYVKQFAMGQHHALAVTEQGRLYVYGRAEDGRLGLGEHDESRMKLEPHLLDIGAKVAKVGTGESTSYAITEKGELYAWGFNESYQCGVGSEEAFMAAPVKVEKNLDNMKVVQIDAGGQHTVLLAVSSE